MAESGIQRFWRLLDTMDFESLPLFSRPYLSWNLQTDYVGRRVIYRPETESTQDDARRMLERLRLRSGAILLTESQSIGVDRDSVWIAPPDLGLQFTLVIFAARDAARSLVYVTPLAIAEAIEQVSAAHAVALKPDLKWPNDVLIGGKKVASVFIEIDVDEAGEPVALIGVGINVNIEPADYPEIAATATSLKDELGFAVAREEVLAAFCNRFEALYEQAASGSRAPFEAWRDRLVTLGQRIDGGVAVDVEDDGSLTVEQPDGSRVRVEPFASGAVD